MRLLSSMRTGIAVCLLALASMQTQLFATEDDHTLSSSGKKTDTDSHAGKPETAPKVRVKKPENETTREASEGEKSEDDSDRESEPKAATKNPSEQAKDFPKASASETVIAVKNIEVTTPAKSANAHSPGDIMLGASVSLMNTMGEIHEYLDTAVGFGVFGQMRLQNFPVTLFAQAGYFNTSSYRVQSMSFIYGQAGIGWPLELPYNLTVTPYLAAGMHTGKYKAATSDISANFLLASFDAGGMLAYPVNREIAILAKAGFMPVLDKFISTNFWHMGLGVTYAF